MGNQGKEQSKMKIGTLKLYKGVAGTIELKDGEGSRYCGRCEINGNTVTYIADTVEDLNEEFHRAVDEYYNSSVNTKSMSRDEMIDFIKKHPNVKITHEMFADFEYILQRDDGKVYNEEGNLFEDQYSAHGVGRDGIRTRVGRCWETGWSVKKG